MISHKQYNYGRGNDEIVKLLYLGKVDQVLTSKSGINLEDLFHLDRAERKVVLIEGAPGAGKSTLAWHICQKWEAGELFQEFKLVVFVQLRDPAIQSAKSLADLFPAQLKSLAREIVSRMETKGGEGLLFVLDGWDEFPPGLHGNRIINTLIRDPLTISMHSSTLLITSRPIASGELHKHASARVETIGFKQAELNLYFNEALENDVERVQQLHICLKKRPVIKASCYLPLNTVIIVHLFLSLDNSLPSTLHGVFLQLVIHCIVRHIMKQQDDDSDPPCISSLDDLPPDMQTQLSLICALAYHGVMKNKVTFSENDLKTFNLPTDISTLSLIQVVVSFMPYRSRSYNFLHLSVQELLTAYYISKLPSKEQVKIFKELFGKPRFAAVFQYYAAFTKLRTAGIEDVIVSIIQRKSKDLFLTLLQCLYEAQDSSLCQFVASKLNGKLDVSNKSLSPVDCIAAGYFLHQCKTISPMTAEMSKCSLDSYKLELFCKELKRPIETDPFTLCCHFTSNNIDGKLTQDIATELIALSSDDISSMHTIIRKVDHSGNPIQDCEDGLSHLCQALATNTSLVDLNLSECKLHETCGPTLCHLLQTNKTLKSLDLSCNYIVSDPSVAGIAEGLRSNRSLKHLNLRFCGIHDAGIKSLSDCLKDMNNSLEELDLHGCTFSREAAHGFSDMLKNNSSLKKLDLSRCKITDYALQSLAKALEVNSTLQELDLSRNGHLTDTALMALGESLKRNTGLKTLGLALIVDRMHSTETTADGWRLFVQCLKDNHSLVMLRTHHAQLNIEDVNTVRRVKRCPELHYELGM